MGTGLRIVTFATFLWAAVSVGAIVYVRAWFRERHGRHGPIPVSHAGSLLHPMRRVLHPPDAMLSWFDLRPGAAALELGPGPGYFTSEASRLVGSEGRVICIDIQPAMLESLLGRLREEGIVNAALLAGDATRLPLAPESVDLAYLVTVLGEVPDRPAALAELHRVLKPGGGLAFAETLTDPDYVFVDTLKDLCRAAGFEYLKERRQPLGYMMKFRKPVEEGGRAAGKRRRRNR
jgi:ubiquinone/menaquinone biosynthesis C-methylase UbiE